MRVKQLREVLEGLQDDLNVEFFDCTYRRDCPINSAEVADDRKSSLPKRLVLSNAFPKGEQDEGPSAA